MSKSSQRKLSAYQQGFDDGLLDNHVQWVAHPMLANYQAGFHDGHYARCLKQKKSLKMTFLERLKFVIFGENI
jgi:hypothetical protein